MGHRTSNHNSQEKEKRKEAFVCGIIVCGIIGGRLDEITHWFLLPRGDFVVWLTNGRRYHISAEVIEREYI